MKHTTKRILSLIVAICLLLPLAPAIQPPARAVDRSSGSVTYVRLEPEAAVLNRYTGYSTKLYDAIKTNAGGAGIYNAIGLLGLNYDSTISEDGRVSWNGYEGSTLQQIARSWYGTDDYSGISACFSALFHNNHHKHKGGILNLQSQEVRSYIDVVFGCPGNGDFYTGFGALSKTSVRRGDQAYLPMRDSTKGLYLTTTNSTFDTAWDTCNHGGSIDKLMITFRDERGPYQDGGARVLRGGTEGTVFKAGDTVEIVLNFDEPLRFADDAAHDNVYIGLKLNGQSQELYARLTALENNKLTFTCQLPTAAELRSRNLPASLSVVSADLSAKGLDVSGGTALLHATADIPLKQVKGSASYTIANPETGGSAEGFTLTSAYVTDLAGNAVSGDLIPVKFAVDGEAPFAAMTDVSATLFNESVKEALGKDDPTANDYLDASDNTLGVGDVIYLRVYLNERTAPFTDLSLQIYSTSYDRVTMETNLCYEDGTPVTVAGQSVSLVDSKNAQYGLGASNGQVNRYTSEALKLEKGMYLSEGDTVKVTKLVFADTVLDLAGNAYTAQTITAAPEHSFALDLTPPTVSPQTLVKNADGSFSLRFTVSDTGSGVNGLTGSFRWTEQGFTCPYQYAIVQAGNTPESWQNGEMGTSCDFTQVDGEWDLFLRPVEGVTYNISRSSLEFRTTDYAGNTGTTECRLYDTAGGCGVLVIDNVKPELRLENSNRALNGTGGGTLTVRFSATEPVDAWYLWKTGDAEPAEGDSWLPAGVSGSYLEASQNVAANSSFSGTLWAKAKDRSGNDCAPVRLGSYSYDLTSVKYGLSYPAGIMGQAEVKVSAIGDSDALVFLLPMQELDREADADLAYLCYYSGASGNEAAGGADPDWNLFAGSGTSAQSGWMLVRYTVTDGKYAFERIGDAKTNGYEGGSSNYLGLYQLLASTENPSHYFVGDLRLTVLAGRAGAFTTAQNSVNFTYATAAGNGAYPVSADTVTLRISSCNNEKHSGVYVIGRDSVSVGTCGIENAFPNAKLTSTVTMTDMPQNASQDSRRPLKTLAGLTFHLSIGKDARGWNYEDIDWENSALVVEHGTEKLEFPISKSLTQDIRMPEADYPAGYSFVYLRLARHSDTTADHRYAYQIVLNGEYARNVWLDPTEFENDVRVESAEFALSTVPGSAGPGLTLASTAQNVPLGEDGKVWTVPTMETGTLTIHFTSDSYAPTEVTDTGVSYGGVIGLCYLEVKNLTTGAEKTLYNKIRDGSALDFQLKCTPYEWDMVLKPGEVNLLELTLVGINGSRTSPRYLSLLPSEGDLWNTGTVRTSPAADGLNFSVAAEPKLYYTPTADYPPIKTMYAYSMANDRLTEMTPQPDGSYLYEIQPGDMTIEDSYLYVYAVDIYGGISYDIAVAPLRDVTAPTVTADSFTCEDGVFTATYTITDECLATNRFTGYNGNGYEGGNCGVVPAPVDVLLVFDDAYGSCLGSPELRLTLAYGEDGQFHWSPDDLSATGITDVDAVLHWVNETGPNANVVLGGSLTVTVTGIVHPAFTGSGMTLSLTATDTCANTSAPAANSGTGVAPAEVKVTGCSYDYFDYDSYDKALFVSFDQPVQPVESWINRNISGYATEWHDAFPITRDGEYEITVRDLFGSFHTLTLTLDGVFGEEGFDLNISTLEDTVDPVTISAASDGDDCFLMPKKVERSGSGYSVTFPPAIENGFIAEETKQMEATASGLYAVLRYPSYQTGEDLSEYDQWERGDWLLIDLTNVAEDAPEAQLEFFFEEYGDSFLPGELPQGVTIGGVKVSYTTQRHVTPTGGTGAEHWFRMGDADSYTFTYEDDFGRAKSVTVDLSELGVTLGEPPEPFRDAAAPIVDVDIYTKTAFGFRQTEYFAGTDDDAAISRAFERAGYASGYSLTLRIRDDSSVKIALKTAAPASASYAALTSDTIPGAELSGNVLTFTDLEALPDSFYVTVCDNASGETAATADNFTSFKLKKSDVTNWLDTTPPEIETQTVQTDLYEKTVYVAVSDKTDDGTDTTAGVTVAVSGAVLETNTGANSAQYPWQFVFRTNAAATVIATDAAGNVSSETVSVSGIDLTPPALSVSWSPCFQDESGLDPASPPIGPVNTNVTAHVAADKPIADVTVMVRDYEEDIWSLLLSGEAEKDGYGYGMWWEFTSQRVSVHYENDVCWKQAKVIVLAPNGQESETVLYLDPASVIDKTAPGIDEYASERKALCREGYSVPYAAEYTIYFTEPVCWLEEQNGAVYDDTTPLILTITDNREHQYRFVDRAGNLLYDYGSMEPYLTIWDMVDNRAPELELTADTEALDASAAGVQLEILADEACTVTYTDGGAEKTVAVEEIPGSTEKFCCSGLFTFTENGTFKLKATDGAGNTSGFYVTISNIDRTLPTIRFSGSTVKLLQNSDPAELEALLRSGVETWDNVRVTGWSYDAAEIDLARPGTYPVVYTVTDAAGNTAEATRYVKVLDARLPVVRIDGQLTEEGGTAVIAAGTHTLEISNLAFDGEPYTLQLVRGTLTAGQMKSAGSGFPVEADGSFTLSGGFYTLYLVTQSRMTYRTTIFVES